MPSECIICRQPKEKFTPEHVIPAAIGGKFIIKTVCSDCNQILGDNIDTPFANHKHILIYRNQYGLNRGGREIKNPLHGKFKDDSSKDFIVLSNDGEFRAEYLPEFYIEETESGPVGRLSLSHMFFSSEDDLVKKYSKVLEEKSGLPFSHYTIERNAPHPVGVEIFDSDNKIILACLKMGYQAAVSCIPEYYNDDLAISYSKILHNYSIDNNLRDFITPPLHVRQKIVKPIKESPRIESSPCFIMLQNTEGIGLTAAVRFFGMFHCFILSSSETYIDERKLLLLNDPIEKKFHPFFIKRPLTYLFTLESAKFTEDHFKELGSVGNDGLKLFINQENLIPLYNSDGGIIFPHIEALFSSVIGQLNYSEIARINSIEFTTENGYLKSNESSLYYPMLKAKFLY